MNAIRAEWARYMADHPGAWEDLLRYLSEDFCSKAAVGEAVCSVCKKIHLEILKVRTTDPSTSKQAAKKNAPRRGSQRFKIIEYLFFHGPATADAWEAEFGWRSGPRAKELRDMGYIEDTGEKALTRYQSESIVYQLTERGRAYIQQK